MFLIRIVGPLWIRSLGQVLLQRIAVVC